ncbi:MAG: GerMN domain-containing protein [Clostridiales bacterium]|nr:GerMN domain-containing protein [Eubacteriales bacterium]MDH7565856.1 GerMN domain-containing protein [Clostridiales bacterium]
MKRRLVLFSMAVFIFLSGCSLPMRKNADGTAGSVKKTAASDNNSIPVKNEASADTKVNETGSKPDSSPKNAGSGQLSVTLYYQDRDGDLIPVTRKVERQEGIARAAIGALIDGTIAREELGYYELYPVLPEGTKVLGINIKQGTAIVDFNEKLLNYGSEKEEKNIVCAVVYTLTEFKTVDSVKILINGRHQGKLKYNTDISGNLDRESILINSDRISKDKGMHKLDAYLFKHLSDQYIYLLPVSVEFKNEQEGDLPSNIIASLGKEYDKRKLYTELPSGVKLLGSSVNGDTITLNFNTEIRNYGGNSREDAILKQILYSMRQIKGVEKAQILIDGKKGTLPEGTDIGEAIPIPVGINEIFD